MTDKQLLDYETKQALLSAISNRSQQLLGVTNDLLQQATEAEEAGQPTLAERLRGEADEYSARATVLRHLWNDAKPVDVRVVLTREGGR